MTKTKTRDIGAKPLILTIMGALFLALLLMASGTRVAAASTAATFDKTQLAKGILGVTYAGDVKGTRVVVIIQFSANGKTEQYQYDVKSNAQQLYPLQQGDGSYKAIVGTVTSDGKVKPAGTETLDVKIDPKYVNDRYLISTPQIRWTKEMEPIKAYTKMFTDGKITATEYSKMVNALYDEVTKTYKYDDDKAKQVQEGKLTGYLPAIEDIYKIKKGICYDYSAMFAGVMRANGVPTRMAHGYSPDLPGVYHAWNQVYLDGKWVTMDLTYDAAYVQANKKSEVKQEKDGSKYQVAKLY